MWIVMWDHVSLDCSCYAVVTYNLPKGMKQVWMHTDKDWQGPQKIESCIMTEEFDFFLKKMFFIMITFLHFYLISFTHL